MFVKSKVVTSRSPLFPGCFDLERLLTINYLYNMTFSDITKMVEDFVRLEKNLQHLILHVIVNKYHGKFQSKFRSHESRKDAVHEFLLRIIFETLKGIIRISCITQFRNDIYASFKRDKNHQIRMNILMKHCRKRFKTSRYACPPILQGFVNVKCKRT